MELGIHPGRTFAVRWDLAVCDDVEEGGGNGVAACDGIQDPVVAAVGEGTFFG